MDEPPELPPELLDPHSIPLPDDIPLPADEIPLPPEEDVVEIEDNRFHQPPTKKRKLAADDNKPALSRAKDDTIAAVAVEYTVPSSEEALMSKIMGFSSFNSTKGKMVPGNQSVGAIHVVKKRRYRQYMNRKGGFNRPLDKVN